MKPAPTNREAKPVYFAKDIPEEWKSVYGPFDPDWRPPQMQGLPRMLTRSMCGCYMHYAANYQEWILCPLHAAAPELLRLLRRYVANETKADELTAEAEALIERLGAE